MRQVLYYIFFMVLYFFPNQLLAAEHHCEKQPEVVISKTQPETAEQICAAAEKAIAFLSRFELFPQRPIHFEITEEQIESHGYSAYGSYDSRIDIIKLMSYKSILKSSAKPQMYGEPFDEVHYSAAIAHEIAHAVVQHNLKAKPISPGPQEYLAHSTQLAVMPEERRQAVIKAMDIEAWESGDAISDIYMAIEPGKFAVKSYKHLTTMLEPLSFVQILLNAKWFYVYVP